MICLDNTDTLEGGASVDAVVDYTVHGLVGTTFTNIAEGQLSDTDPSVLYTASAAISIISITLVNTHTAAVTVNLYLDPANAGTPRRMIPKNLSLGIGYSMIYDGARFAVLDTNGNQLTSGDSSIVSDIAYEAGWDGVTAIAPSKNAVYDKIETLVPKASPTFTGQATIPTINLTGGQIVFPATAVPSADPNTLDDYEEGEHETIATMTTSGTVTLAADKNTLAYTKMGRQITITGKLVVSSVSSPVGELRFSLPFTIGDLTDFAGRIGAGIYTYSVVYNSGSYAVIYALGGETLIRIKTCGDGLLHGNVAPAADDEYGFSFSYFI